MLGAVLFVDCKTLEGTVPGKLDCPLQKRAGEVMPEPIPMNMEDLGLCLKACFWLNLIDVSCITLKSSFHDAIGKRCLAARALIVARTLGFEAMAAFIAILNWLIKCLLVVDSIVNHQLDTALALCQFHKIASNNIPRHIS